MPAHITDIRGTPLNTIEHYEQTQRATNFHIQQHLENITNVLLSSMQKKSFQLMHRNKEFLK
jgi:hypothetical protein